MTLKDQIAADNSAVFINAAEFGQLVSLDGGDPVPCVREDLELTPQQELDGVFPSEFKLRTLTSHFTTEPVVTQRLVVDGKPARILHVEESLGITTLLCAWWES